jgi:hypothetical protein
MNLGELIQSYRTYADDFEDPPLFSNGEVIRYINAGYIEACRRGRLIIDSSTEEIVKFTLAAGQNEIVLDPRVIHIRRVYLPAKKQTLCWEKTEIMDYRMPGWMDETGELAAFITDLDSRKIRFYPTPEVDVDVVLTVVREPLTKLARPNDVPEIAERYHEGIVFYALHLGYMKQDVEVEDKRMSGIWGGKFDKEFGTKDYASAMEEEFLMRQPRLFNDGRW